MNLRSDPKLYQRGETIDMISPFRRSSPVVNVSSVADVHRSKAQERTHSLARWRCV